MTYEYLRIPHFKDTNNYESLKDISIVVSHDIIHNEIVEITLYSKGLHQYSTCWRNDTTKSKDTKSYHHTKVECTIYVSST